MPKNGVRSFFELSCASGKKYIGFELLYRLKLDLKVYKHEDEIFLGVQLPCSLPLWSCGWSSSTIKKLLPPALFYVAYSHSRQLHILLFVNLYTATPFVAALSALGGTALGRLLPVIARKIKKLENSKSLLHICTSIYTLQLVYFFKYSLFEFCDDA